MRYTKLALLIFGLGLMLGFVIVVGEFARYERVASALMALGLALLPVALFADGRGVALLAWIVARLSRGKRKKARPKRRAKTRPGAKRQRPQAARTALAPRR